MTTIVTENKVTTIVTIGVQGPQGIQGPPGDASAIAWGTLTGTLSNQTDLNSALSGKSSTSHTHTGTYEPANANIQTHIGTTGNPHGVTKSDVGLSNVDNTSDANKPISTATQTALNGKSDTSHNHTTISISTSYVQSGTTSITYSQDAVYYATCATAGTTWAITGLPSSGTVASWTVELTNGGLFTQTWFANTKWDGGTIPTLTSSGLDILTFYTRDGGTTIRGFLVAKDSK